MSERKINELGRRGRSLLNLDDPDQAAMLNVMDNQGATVPLQQTARRDDAWAEETLSEFALTPDNRSTDARVESSAPNGGKTVPRRSKAATASGGDATARPWMRYTGMGAGAFAVAAAGAFMVLDFNPSGSQTAPDFEAPNTAFLAQVPPDVSPQDLYAELQDRAPNVVAPAQHLSAELRSRTETVTVDRVPSVSVENSGVESLMAGSAADMERRMREQGRSGLGLASGSSDDSDIDEQISELEEKFAEALPEGEPSVPSEPDQIIAQLDSFMEDNTVVPQANQRSGSSVTPISASCEQFAEDLNACRPSRCRLIDAASGKRIGGKVLGELNGNCLYEHAAEGNLRRACTLARPERGVAASYYAALTENDVRVVARFAVNETSSSKAHLKMRDVFERAMNLVLEDTARCRILGGVKSDW